MTSSILPTTARPEALDSGKIVADPLQILVNLWHHWQCVRINRHCTRKVHSEENNLRRKEPHAHRKQVLYLPKESKAPHDRESENAAQAVW